MLENANMQEVKNFIKEIEIMKSVGKHENIVTLLGVSTNLNGKNLFLIYRILLYLIFKAR
jgi:hypothetical protein